MLCSSEELDDDAVDENDADCCLLLRLRLETLSSSLWFGGPNGGDGDVDVDEKPHF